MAYAPIMLLLASAFALHTVNVWPNYAPGETTKHSGDATRVGNETHMTNITYPLLYINNMPKRLTPFPAVIINPGGGYNIVVTDKEGSEIATWLNQQGYFTAVLTYRVPNKRDAAYQDIQRAMSLLRSRATEFNIDTSRIGIIGFSAGGHLTARITSSDGKRTYQPVDDHDKVPFNPNFSLLIYPAYLIDKHVPAPEVTPRKGMPRMFLEQTKDDYYLCAPEYTAALEKVGVSATLALYDKGGHGYGLRDPPGKEWAKRAQEWLSGQNMNRSCEN
jgi:acetyl esterase/lipase